MSTLLTDWRAALVAFLEEAFPPPAEVISGARSGVSRDLERLCVFWPGWQEDGDVSFARPTMIVRFWPARSKQPTQNPDDPAQLEQAAVDLLTALQTVQNPGDLVPDLYCRVASLRPDYDPEEWGVEATLTAWTPNLAVIAP